MSSSPASVPCAACISPAFPPARFRTVALVGPPNSGKTTLFNRLTGLRQKVANFPGVTVEQHLGYVRDMEGEDVTLIDLPGVYSLTPRSEDARVTVDVLHGRMPGTPRPDGIMLVLDATNLGRHLALAVPVVALGLPTLVILNMADSLHSRGGQVDPLALARELGTPVVLASASEGEGLVAITQFLCLAPNAPAPAALPVLQDVPACQTWARRVSESAGYRRPLPAAWTRRLDAALLHRVWGPIIFLLVVVAVFQSIFLVGQPLSDLLQHALQKLGALVASQLPSGLMKSILLDGAWNGTAAVLVFLPQIMFLFLVIGILEDSGYLTRAAVIADRTMAKVGLNGKAFIPLLSAYACAVPAIMATRTIENKRDRLATVLIAPFMTCSARLPVYSMVIAAFVPNRHIAGSLFGSRAASMLALYVLGFVVAVITARVLKSSILKSSDTHFVLELPPYRWPTPLSLALRVLDRAKAFVLRAGTVILLVSLALAVLAHVPPHPGRSPAIQNSVVGRLGHVIEPVVAPLGLDWRIGVGLVTSVAARETIIGTLGTLYGVDPDSRGVELQQALRRELSPASAVALLILFALAMQCVSTMAVVRRETNSWRWPALQFVYMGVVAYAAAYIGHLVVVHLFA
ncbi:MAG TPA: ferrous iron transport protein B [Terriglobales bacterium]|nr:ferrous iron transport protein B [Terriglobales bacterium]